MRLRWLPVGRGDWHHGTIYKIGGGGTRQKIEFGSLGVILYRVRASCGVERGISRTDLEWLVVLHEK